MKPLHMPRVDLRYWFAILLASVCGTNLGEYYAHESGLGLGAGLAALAVLCAAVFVIERLDTRVTELYYWLVILIIRTGATNIADTLAFRVRVPEPELSLLLAALIIVFALWQNRGLSPAAYQGPQRTLPPASGPYWCAMLGAGVLGTVDGDVSSHLIGQGPASMLLLALLCFALTLKSWGPLFGGLAVYWIRVVIARTAGTAIGEFLAEDRHLSLGLPTATFFTVLAFFGVALLWRPERTASTRPR
jgi:uncharacterized membrane-anchored protein